MQFLYTFTMQQKRLALSLLAAMAGVATAESDVAQLTKDTFNDFVKENDLVLAECKFCEPSSSFTQTNYADFTPL